MNIGELFVKLGVVADTSTLKRFSDGVDSAVKNVVNLKNAIGLAALYGMERFVSHTVDGIMAMNNFNQQTGLSVELLRKWQVAGQMSNIAMSAEEISGSISSLQKNLTAIRLGGGNIRPFQLLGVDISGKNAFQVLEDLRGIVKNMDRPVAVNLLEQAGLNANFISLLTRSRKEFDELSKVPFLNRDQRAKVKMLGEELKMLKINLKTAKDFMVADFQPVFSSIIQVIGNAASAFGWLTSKVAGMKEGIGILKLAIAALMVTLFPLTSMLLGLLLVLDDITTYMHGGKSITGDVMDFLYGKKDKNHPSEERVGAIDRIKNAWNRGYFFGDWKEGENKYLANQAKGTAGNQSNANFNNTFNIFGAEDSREVANTVLDTMNHQYKGAMMETNR